MLLSNNSTSNSSSSTMMEMIRMIGMILVGYAVVTPMIQLVIIYFFRSKYPKTTPKTAQLLMKNDIKDVMAVPSLTYLPFRMVGNIFSLVSLLPGFMCLTITILLPLYVLQYYVRPYVATLFWFGDHVLFLLIGSIIGYEVWKQLTMPQDHHPFDTLPPREKKRVCIIGAGGAGLCVAKELVAEGHEPIIYDRTSAIGGLWQRNIDTDKRPAVVLEETYTSSSALNTAFSDFPIQAEFGGPETYCMPQESYMKYLDMYADHFDLKKYVQFNTEVISVQRTKKSNDCEEPTWIVCTKQDGGKVIEQEYDYVAICTGQANHPRIPKLPGQEYFHGTIRHSSELRTPTQIQDIYKNKSVLSVGGGESASDNAHVVANAAKQCDLSIRNCVLVLDRNLFGAHADYTEHRTMLSCPHFVRWATYKLFIIFCFPWHWSFARYWNGTRYERPKFWIFWKLLFTPRYFYDTLFKGRSLCGSIQTTKTEMYAHLINAGTAKVKPGICHINEKGQIVFRDGTVGVYDEILLNTGFLGNKFPFLPDGFSDGISHTRDDRYLGMIHPQLPNMAFIGFARGNVGALVLGFEMQARWFALLVSKKRTLPTLCEMKRIIAIDHLDKDTYEYSRASWMYANYLARYHVGCEPNVIQFFMKHPITCLKAICGPPTGYLYRMRGPHPNPQAVVEGYSLSSSAILHLPPSWGLNHPIWFLCGIACNYVWSRLPIVGKFFRPTIDNYQ